MSCTPAAAPASRAATAAANRAARASSSSRRRHFMESWIRTARTASVARRASLGARSSCSSSTRRSSGGARCPPTWSWCGQRASQALQIIGPGRFTCLQQQQTVGTHAHAPVLPATPIGGGRCVRGRLGCVRLPRARVGAAGRRPGGGGVLPGVCGWQGRAGGSSWCMTRLLLLLERRLQQWQLIISRWRHCCCCQQP